MTLIKSYSSLAAATLICLSGQFAISSEIEGFTEPYRNIDVAAADSGIISEMKVKEGEKVTKGQLLSELNNDVLKASLDIAERSRKSEGKLKSAKAEMRLKQERLTKLNILLQRQHASQEEVDRTAVEKEVAEAQLLNVEEELLIRSLEYDRIQVQIELRMVRSPLDGVVTKVSKDVGEFVSPADPVVVSIVQLDPLKAVFSVPGSAIDQIEQDGKISVLLGEGRGLVTGTVEFISPVTNAESGTTQIKVLLPNPNGEIRSGERCFITLKGDPKTQQADTTEEQPVNAVSLPKSRQ